MPGVRRGAIGAGPMKPPGPTVDELQAQVIALKLALEMAKAGAEPDAKGVTMLRGAGGWELHLGEIPEDEAELFAAVVAEFLRARQKRKRIGLSGATIVRCDETPDRPPAIRAWIEAGLAKRKIA